MTPAVASEATRDPTRDLQHALRDAHRILDAHTGKAVHQCRPGDPPLGLWRRALGAPGAFVDRLTLKIMEPIFVSGGTPDMSVRLRERVEEGKRLYADPGFYTDPASFFRPTAPPAEFSVKRLARLNAGVRLRLTFESPYATYDPGYQAEYSRRYARNQRNVVHFWRHNDARRPTLICVHPWCLGYLAFDEVVFAARSFYKQGFNVVLFTMPFHGKRAPKRTLSGVLFPSNHIQRTNEAFGQAVADLRTIMGWLRDDQGTGPIGMMGFSLGGYTTALMASLEASLSFAIPIVAPATFADLMWFHGEGNSRRKLAEDAGVNLDDLRLLMSVHSPLMHSLAIPRDRTLIVWGQGDRIVPSVHQLALWEHWGRPRIASFPGSHMLHVGRMGRRGYLRIIQSWLKQRVLAP